MPVYIEASILTLPHIYINGGRRGFLVALPPRRVPNCWVHSRSNVPLQTHPRPGSLLCGQDQHGPHGRRSPRQCQLAITLYGLTRGGRLRVVAQFGATSVQHSGMPYLTLDRLGEISQMTLRLETA